MGKKWLTVAVIALPIALALTGCTTSPVEAGIQKCQDPLQYEIEQVVTEPDAGWSDSELAVEITSTESRDGNDYVHDIYGTATVNLKDGNAIDVKWGCFTQTADGNTYATVTHINGECSLTYREASPDKCD